jgi:hypothetical protein
MSDFYTPLIRTKYISDECIPPDVEEYMIEAGYVPIFIPEDEYTPEIAKKKNDLIDWLSEIGKVEIVAGRLVVHFYSDYENAKKIRDAVAEKHKDKKSVMIRIKEPSKWTRVDEA